MSRLSIELQRHPDSGQLEIVIGLLSDDDLPPQEHERVHRRIVERLLPGIAERLAVRIERVKPAREPVVG